MARIYLHIGIEKTGTTSLQAFLRENHFALQQRGLDYIGRDDSPYFEGIAHGPLAACLLPQAPEFVSAAKHAPADVVLAALRRDIDAAGSAVVLSSEHLSSRIREVEPVRRLAAALAGHEVRIVCYVRRQDDLALAGYTTAVRAGRRDPFDAREALLGGWYYDLRRMLALWAGVFGREAMIVRKYRTDRDWDVRRDFLDVVGIEPTPDLVFGQAQNVSLDAMQVELLRIVNAALPSRTDSDRLAASTGDRIRALVLDSMPKGAPLGSMLGLIDRNRIIDRFSAGNRAIEAEYMEPGALADWFDLVPGRPGRPGGAAGADAGASLDTAHLAASLVDLARRLDAANAELAGLRAAAATRKRRPVRDWIARLRRLAFLAVAAMGLAASISVASGTPGPQDDLLPVHGELPLA